MFDLVFDTAVCEFEYDIENCDVVGDNRECL